VLVVRSKSRIAEETHILQDAFLVGQATTLQQARVALGEASTPKEILIETTSNLRWQIGPAALCPKGCITRGNDLLLKSLALRLSGTEEFFDKLQALLE
jgi:hypothetical protein